MSGLLLPDRWQSLPLASSASDSANLASTLQRAGVRFETLAPPLWRLKPGPAAVATLFEAGPSADGWPLGYLLAIDPTRLDATLEKALSLHPVGYEAEPGVRLIPGLSALFFAFPNDRHLRALKLVVDRDKLKRLLAELPRFAGRRVRGRKTELRPIRYKPERRFLLRAELEHVGPEATDPRSASLFLRFFTDERGQRIDDILRRLAMAGLGALVPEPEGTLLSGQLQIENALPGEPATQALRQDRLEVSEVLSVLLALRDAKAGGLDPILPGNLLAETNSMLDTLGGAAVATSAEIQALESRLSARMPEASPLRWVHGDFHLGQCLRTPTGLQIIDFERTGSGDPNQDLGNLLATLQAWRLGEPSLSPKIGAFEERLLAACVREGLTLESLPFFHARALIELATLPIRRLQPQWPTLARALFLAAQASLP